MTIENEKYLSTEEAAAFLKCHKYSVMTWARQRKIRFGKVGRKYRFLEKDLRDFVAGGGAPRR